MKLLEDAKRDGRPFFILHAFYQVHTPLQAPATLVEKYKEKARQLGLKDEFGEEPQYYSSVKAPRRVRTVQSHATYAAMVESMDTAFGRILRKLDELGLAENTLVVFTSDNGGLSTAEGMPTSNLPFRGGKGWVYEGGIREPLLARWPAHLPAGRDCAEPTVTYDLFSTALEAAHAAAPQGTALDGRSFLASARGESTAPRDLFWHYPHYGNQGGFPGGAVRSGDWKLTENYEDGSIQLFNLAADPGERHDLSHDEPARATDLRQRLHAWYHTVEAKFLSARAGGPTPWQP